MCPNRFKKLLVPCLIISLCVYFYLSYDAYSFDDLAGGIERRLLCLIVTSRLNHLNMDLHIKTTWGKRCNTLLFVNSEDVTNLSFMHLQLEYGNLTDWFLKTDDDFFVAVENLHHLFSSYDSTKTIWFGHSLQTNDSTHSNIDAYVLSREAVRKLAQESPRCGFNFTVNKEEIHQCLNRLNITTALNVTQSPMPYKVEQSVTTLNLLRFEANGGKTWNPIRHHSQIFFWNISPAEMHVLEDLIYDGATGDHNSKVNLITSGPPEEDSKRIIFLETSGRSHMRRRHACAVESAARHNPDRPVQVLFFNATPNVDSSTMHVFAHYPNIRVYQVSYNDYFQGTPFESWFQDGRWKSSPHVVAHTSDYLRILTLWKGGGTYLDSDFVILRSLADLGNFSCAESNQVTSNGVIDLSQGHPLLRILVDQMSKVYEPNQWSSNGPGALYRSLQAYCNQSNIDFMTKENCGDFDVLPSKYFYPIGYPAWRRFFDISNPSHLNEYNDSYALHVWNKLSSDTKVPEGSLYALAASMHCPITYHVITDVEF